MEFTSSDIGALALGCALLGAGGGGSTDTAELILRHRLGDGSVELVDRVAAGRVVVIGAVGSAEIMQEDLPTPSVFTRAVDLVRSRTPDVGAVMPLEVGGVNGLLGMLVGAAAGLPVLDADPHGRAYTRIDLSTMTRNLPIRRLAFVGATGEQAWFEADESAACERMVRAILPSTGGWGVVAWEPGPMDAVLAHAVPGTLSRAIWLGRDLKRAREHRSDVLMRRGDVRGLATGTVTEVVRWPGVESGGVASIEESGGGHVVRLDFGNEYVAAYRDGALLACAPDLLCVLQVERWAPVQVDRLSPGQQVHLAAVDAPEQLQQADGSAGFGPRSHGYAEVAR